MGSVKFMFCTYKDKSIIEKIADLNSEAFSMDKDGYVNMLYNLKPNYLLMLMDNELIGVCKVINLDSNSVRITNVIIENRYRGKGYGSKLLSELKKRYKTITLNAYTKNNFLFYKKNGFELIKHKMREEIIDNVSDGKDHSVEGLWKMEWSKNRRIKTLGISKERVKYFGIFNW